MKILIATICLFAAAQPALAAHPAPLPGASPLEPVEALFLEFLDAANAVDYINSGLVADYEGRDLASWDAQINDRYRKLVARIAALDQPKLTADDAAALAAIGVTLADYGNPSPAVANAETELACKDRDSKSLGYDDLRTVLSSCYREIGNNLKFEDGTIDRGGALGLLYDLEGPARRKALFDAFLPLWQALNGANEADSPYRRLILAASKEAASNGSGIEAAARAIGVTVPDVERWLVLVLEAWRDANPGPLVEPWDYRHQQGEANRLLASAFAGKDLLALDHRFYLDLGADLDQLGVVYDIKNRPDKSPLAYTDFLRRGRHVDGRWQPTIARVVGRYEDGGLGSINELLHENGHAVHISAIHNRPAFTDWTDTLFTEAFADVPAWSAYEPAWQRKYLGTEIPVGVSLRGLFGSVMMDVAWSLFELRMLRAPETDPNALWTELMTEYLRITPHPEVAWWAVRVQLVRRPGYMINYGLGSVLTAEIRKRTEAAIGSFDAGNPRWYGWNTEQMLRYGSERTAKRLLEDLLGRPLAPDAVLEQIKRIGAGS